MILSILYTLKLQNELEGGNTVGDAPTNSHQQDVLDQVKKQRKNLFIMWFDYRKAFDSVPHRWIIKALELAKVPNKILIAIRNMMDLWATKDNLFANNTSIETNTTNYITGVLQGDSLSLIICIIC